MKRLRGFAAVEIVLLLVIVGLFSFVIWKVIDANNNDIIPNESTVIEEKIPAVTQSSDLDTLATELNDTDIDNSYDAELQTQSDF